MMLHSFGFQAGYLRRIAALAVLAVAALLLLHDAPNAAWAQRTLPDVPQNVTVTPGDASLTLTWEAPSSWGDFSAGGYEVDWYAGASPPANSEDWKRASNGLTATATSYTFTGTYQGHTVANGTTYHLRIRSYTVNPSDDEDTLPSTWVVASGTPRAASTDATLSDLTIANATTGSDASAGPVWAYGPRVYTAVMLREITSVTVRPTATDSDGATITVQLESGGTPQTVASGADSSAIAVTPHADPDEWHNILVKVTAENDDTLTYTLRVYQYPPVSFGAATIPDLTFTQGVEVQHGPLPSGSDDYEVTYEATGLPAGLSLSSVHRAILGTPTTVTASPATVTYTGTGELGSTASLTFQVSVAPPVTFDAAKLEPLRGRTIDYTVGQAARINVTLPEASGGAGDLTYHLTYRVDEGSGTVEKTIDDDAPGFSFDSGSRVLTSDAAPNAPSAAAYYGVRYWAEDQNGARASAPFTIVVWEAPSLPAVADQALTVGVAASVALPKASGDGEGGRLPMDYELSPSVDGLSFDAWERTISGKPLVPVSTEMTYTVTDSNDVSDSATFNITVDNGPNAPTAAPGSLEAMQETSSPAGLSASATWDAVTGATGYVVQVIADGGSFPDKPVESAPDGVVLTTLTDGTSHWVVISALSAGDYKVRVAGRNDDGVGPWSAEASFTVKVGGV